MPIVLLLFLSLTWLQIDYFVITQYVYINARAQQLRCGKLVEDGKDIARYKQPFSIRVFTGCYHTRFNYILRLLYLQFACIKSCDR